jgi:hypothetical protein
VLNTISLVRSEGNSAQVNVRSYVSLYTPRKGSFDLLAPGTASITSYSRPMTGSNPNAGGLIGNSTFDPSSRDQWQLKVNENDALNRVNLPLDASNTGSVLIDGQTRLSGSFESGLQVRGSHISGTITNRTGETVDDVVLDIGTDVHSVGRMSNGQRKNVDFTFTPGSPSAGPDAQRVKIALESVYQNADATRANRENVIDSVLGSNNGSQAAGLTGLTLLGWLENSPIPLQVAGQHPSVKSTNLYVTDLPLQFQRGTDILIPPAHIETKQIGTFSTNFQRLGQYELNPSGSLALEFALPLQASDMASNDLVLHMNGHYSNGSNQRLSSQPRQGQPLGQLFLYNWQTSDWDAQDFVWGDNPLQNAGPYLSATSTLRLRYTYKPPSNLPPQQQTTSIQFSLDLTDQGQLR